MHQSLLKMEKPLSEGLRNQQVSGKTWGGQLESLYIHIQMSRTRGRERVRPKELFRKRNYCLGRKAGEGSRALTHEFKGLAFLLHSSEHQE